MRSAFQQYAQSVFKTSRYANAIHDDISRQIGFDGINEDVSCTNNGFARDEVILGIPAHNSSETKEYDDDGLQRLDFYVACTSDNFEPFRQWAYEKLTAPDKYRTTDRRILQIEQCTGCVFAVDDYLDSSSILRCLNSPPTFMYCGELHRKITILAADSVAIVEVLGLLEDSVPDLMSQMKMIETVDWYGTRRWPRKGEMAICRRPSGPKTARVAASVLQHNYDYLPWKMREESVKGRRNPKKSVKRSSIVNTLIEMFAERLEQTERVQTITDQMAKHETPFQTAETRRPEDEFASSVDRQISKPELIVFEPQRTSLPTIQEQPSVTPSPNEEPSPKELDSDCEAEIGGTAVEEAADILEEECIDAAIEAFGKILLVHVLSSETFPNNEPEDVQPDTQEESEVDASESFPNNEPYEDVQPDTQEESEVEASETFPTNEPEDIQPDTQEESELEASKSFPNNEPYEDVQPDTQEESEVDASKSFPTNEPEEEVQPDTQEESELDSLETFLEMKLDPTAKCNGSIATDSTAPNNETTPDETDVSVGEAMLRAKMAVCQAEEAALKENVGQTDDPQGHKTIIDVAVKKAQRAIEFAETCVIRAQGSEGRAPVCPETGLRQSCVVVEEDIVQEIMIAESPTLTESGATNGAQPARRRSTLKTLMRKMKATAYSFQRPKLRWKKKCSADNNSSSIEDFDVESAMFEMCDSTLLKTVSDTSSMWAVAGSVHSIETCDGSVTSIDSNSLNEQTPLWPILRNSEPCGLPSRRRRLVFRLDDL